MGLAVLPARLRDEIAIMCEYIAEGKDFSQNEDIEKHKEWFDSIKDKYTFTPENTENILKEEIGAVFQRVLEDAGVYKRTDEGKSAFLRFIDSVNNKDQNRLIHSTQGIINAPVPERISLFFYSLYIISIFYHKNLVIFGNGNICKSLALFTKIW